MSITIQRPSPVETVTPHTAKYQLLEDLLEAHNGDIVKVGPDDPWVQGFLWGYLLLAKRTSQRGCFEAADALLTMCTGGAPGFLVQRTDDEGES